MKLERIYLLLDRVDDNVIRLFATFTSIVLGIGYMFGPSRLHTSTALHYVTVLPIPFWLWGVLFLASGLFLISEKYHMWGYMIAAMVVTFFDLAMWLSLVYSGGTLLAPCSLLMMAILYWVSFKFSVFDKFDPERRATQ